MVSARDQMRRRLKDSILDALAAMWRTGQEPASLPGLLLQFRQLDDMDGRLTDVFERALNQLRDAKPEHPTIRSEREFVYEVRNRYSLLLQESEQKREKAWFDQWLGEFEKSRAKAQSEFEALGVRMSMESSREELVSIGRRRADLASLTGRTFIYENHCWLCKSDISSEIHAQCPKCRWYICSCGACGCQYERGHTWYGGS